jgi:uncharacterized protein
MSQPPLFVGRTTEQRLLESRWRSQGSELVVLYGRRRVGKTELLRHFSRGKRTLFAVGTRSEKRSQVRHFVEGLSQLTGETDLAGLPIHDWDTALGRLNAFLQKARGKTLLILDEFQWMAEASPELPSVLQKWWDQHWSRQGRLFLVLCGSYMGFMEREVLAHRSPLFGRRTAVLHLKPLPFQESRKFHSRLPLKEQMKRHLLCGGIPAYHKFFSSSESLSSQLIASFLEPDAPLAKEADFLLMEELKEPKLYFSLLEALGSSRKGVSELAALLGIERSRIPYYTKALMDLRYIEKRTPTLTYRHAIERKSAYAIGDPLLRFWFAFVYPNASLLERTDPRVFYATTMAPQLDAYWGQSFESLAAELFLSHELLPKLAEPFKLGSYWDKNIQIDFTIALKSGLSYLGETKWGTVDEKMIRSYCGKLAYFEKKTPYLPVMISAEPVSLALQKRVPCAAYSLQELVS